MILWLIKRHLTPGGLFGSIGVSNGRKGRDNDVLIFLFRSKKPQAISIQMERSIPLCMTCHLILLNNYCAFRGIRWIEDYFWPSIWWLQIRQLGNVPIRSDFVRCLTYTQCVFGRARGPQRHAMSPSKEGRSGSRIKAAWPKQFFSCLHYRGEGARETYQMTPQLTGILESWNDDDNDWRIRR